MNIPGAGGEWGAGAQLLLMAAASSPLLPLLKAGLGEIFSLDQVLFFFFSSPWHLRSAISSCSDS